MSQWVDPIVADVRRNRESLLADFGGDIHELIQSLKKRHPVMESTGWEAVTIEEVEESKAAFEKRAVIVGVQK